MNPAVGRAASIRPDTFQVAEPTLDDVPQLGSLLSILFTQEADFQPDPARQSIALRLIIQHPEFGQILVARDSAALLGMVNLLFTPSVVHGGSTVLLEDMVVHPAHRGKGIGSALLGRAIALAQSRGFFRISLLTDHTNQPAIRFYQSHGFHPVSRGVMRFPVARCHRSQFRGSTASAH
jgi:ribosomal protein S18 acetylase RimI-like enzyme